MSETPITLPIQLAINGEVKIEKKEPYQFKSMEFEDILSAVGDYGKFQKRLVYFFLIPTSFILPFFCMNLIFMMSSPDHWCAEPSVSASNLSLADRRLLISPLVNDTAEGKQVPSKCQMYDVDYESALTRLNADYNVSMLTENSASWPVKDCPAGWDYDTQYYSSTATTKWDLVCLKDYLPSLVFTLSNAGSAMGTPVLGFLSDKVGRKKSYLITAVVALASSILTVLVSNFVVFVIVRTINGGLFPSVYQIPYLILVEIVSPEMRTRMNGISCVSWTLGLSALPLVAYISGNWIIFGWICAIVTLPYILYVKFLPESPRWLMSQGRYEDASKILNEMAKVNGKDVSHLDLINVFKGKPKISGENPFNQWGVNLQTLRRSGSGIITQCHKWDRTRLLLLRGGSANHSATPLLLQHPFDVFLENVVLYFMTYLSRLIC